MPRKKKKRKKNQRTLSDQIVVTNKDKEVAPTDKVKEVPTTY